RPIIMSLRCTHWIPMPSLCPPMPSQSRQGPCCNGTRWPRPVSAMCMAADRGCDAIRDASMRSRPAGFAWAEPQDFNELRLQALIQPAEEERAIHEQRDHGKMTGIPGQPEL